MRRGPLRAQIYLNVPLVCSGLFSPRRSSDSVLLQKVTCFHVAAFQFSSRTLSASFVGGLLCPSPASRDGREVRDPCAVAL